MIHFTNISARKTEHLEDERQILSGQLGFSDLIPDSTILKKVSQFKPIDRS